MPENELERAFQEVKGLVLRMARGETVRKELLKALFVLNNEIGRTAREESSMQELRPLQQSVNAITVAAKNYDSKLMKDSLDSAEEILDKLRRVSRGKEKA